jgi:hypothetical protein
MENKKGKKKKKKIKKKNPRSRGGKEVKRSEARREWGGRAGEGREKRIFFLPQALFTGNPSTMFFPQIST